MFYNFSVLPLALFDFTYAKIKSQMVSDSSCEVSDDTYIVWEYFNRESVPHLYMTHVSQNHVTMEIWVSNIDSAEQNTYIESTSTGLAWLVLVAFILWTSWIHWEKWQKQGQVKHRVSIVLGNRVN